MGQISQFLRKGSGFLSHYCPACKELHAVHVDVPNAIGCQWSWDGNIVIPTLSPSINIAGKRDGRIISRCHYTLLAGVLDFLPDCTHYLAGVKMQLPALPFYLRDECHNF